MKVDWGGLLAGLFGLLITSRSAYASPFTRLALGSANNVLHKQKASAGC